MQHKLNDVSFIFLNLLLARSAIETLAKMVEKLNPIDVWSDPRVEHKTALVNGQTYKYLLGVPEGGKFRATVFLVC